MDKIEVLKLFKSNLITQLDESVTQLKKKNKNSLFTKVLKIKYF